MSEEKTFSQEEVNQIVEERIARAREKWQKERESSAETENLKAALEAKEAEISAIRRERFFENAQRDVRAELARRGVTDEGRIERVMKLIDFSEASDRSLALAQIDDVAKDIPELVRPRGAGSGGSSKPVLKQEKPLTREEVEGMSEQEINSNWNRVKAFLAGERT
jgi:intergrase/recombinase